MTGTPRPESTMVADSMTVNDMACAPSAVASASHRRYLASNCVAEAMAARRHPGRRYKLFQLHNGGLLNHRLGGPGNSAKKGTRSVLVGGVTLGSGLASGNCM